MPLKGPDAENARQAAPGEVLRITQIALVARLLVQQQAGLNHDAAVVGIRRFVNPARTIDAIPIHTLRRPQMGYSPAVEPLRPIEIPGIAGDLIELERQNRRRPIRAGVLGRAIVLAPVKATVHLGGPATENEVKHLLVRESKRCSSPSRR